MNFVDAVRKSMKKFMEGKLDMKSIPEVTEGEIIYTPEYFDILEEEMLAEPHEEPKEEEKDK